MVFWKRAGRGRICVSNDVPELRAIMYKAAAEQTLGIGKHYITLHVEEMEPAARWGAGRDRGTRDWTDSVSQPGSSTLYSSDLHVQGSGSSSDI